MEEVVRRFIVGLLDHFNLFNLFFAPLIQESLKGPPAKDNMLTRFLQRLETSLVVVVILLSVLDLGETHTGKSVSSFENTTRRRSENDCQELVSACWIRSLAAKEDNKTEERTMVTRWLQLPEEMRSVDEKLLFHGDRLSKVPATNIVNTVFDVLARLDKNIMSVVNERMRKVWQKGSLKPGNRRQLGGTNGSNTCDGALEAKSLFDRCLFDDATYVHAYA